MKYICRCCGCRTLDEETNGTYEICPVCFWEDDPLQSRNENYRGGANEVSLNEAKKNYLLYGACDEKVLSLVREPFAEELL